MFLLPQPQLLEMQDGSLPLLYAGDIIIDSRCDASVNDYAKLLQHEIADVLGFHYGLTRKAAPEAGAFFISKAAAKRPESYTLTVSEDYVRIEGADNAGILYAIQTLRQIIRQNGASLPALHIEDFPDMQNRGFYHDVTRGRVPTLDYLKKLVDTCSFYKINQLQLYVEHTYLFKGLTELWRDTTPLTAEEIMELDAYCRKYEIELVPSLASFGHLYTLLCSQSYHHLCELEGSADRPFSLDDRMMHHTIDISNPESFELIKSMLGEYMQLFSSRYFNICADETFDLGKGRTAALAAEKGSTTLYVEFLTKLCHFIMENGRTPMFWSDVIAQQPEVLTQIPEDAICLHWDYDPMVSEERLEKLVNAGGKNIYVCPGAQGWNHLINNHFDAYTNISKMCSFAYRYHATGILNTDWGDFGHVNHPEFSTVGLIYGAAFSWNKHIESEENLNRAISVVQYKDNSEQLVSLFREIGMWDIFPWYHVVRFKELLDIDHDEARAKEMLFYCSTAEFTNGASHLEKGMRDLYAALKDAVPATKTVINAYLIMAEGTRLLNLTGAALCRYRYGKTESNAPEPKQLAKQLELWTLDYRALWRSVSKESELARIVEVFTWYADYLRNL